MNWFKSLNATPRLLLSFGVLIFLIAIISYLSLSNLSQANDRVGTFILLTWWARSEPTRSAWPNLAGTPRPGCNSEHREPRNRRRGQSDHGHGFRHHP